MDCYPRHSADLLHRASVVSEKRNANTYSSANTPVAAAAALEAGQLRPGSIPSLWSRECFGLCVNNIAVGAIHGFISKTQYPFFNIYLHMDGYQLLAAFTLINMPFSLKTFIAILSDSYPIFGSRRKAYMNIGWALCGLTLAIMAVLPLPEPYYVDPSEVTIIFINRSYLGGYRKARAKRRVRYIFSVLLFF